MLAAFVTETEEVQMHPTSIDPIVENKKDLTRAGSTQETALDLPWEESEAPHQAEADDGCAQ